MSECQSVRLFIVPCWYKNILQEPDIFLQQKTPLNPTRSDVNMFWWWTQDPGLTVIIFQTTDVPACPVWSAGSLHFSSSQICHILEFVKRKLGQFWRGVSTRVYQAAFWNIWWGWLSWWLFVSTNIPDERWDLSDWCQQYTSRGQLGSLRWTNPLSTR